MPDFLPDLPVDQILVALRAAPGNRLKTGKFDSPESSSALAVNAFGWFLERAAEFPVLPGGMGKAKEVMIEAQMRFPWAGGKPVCLDAAIVTDRYLIGIECKRYEPFRPAKKSDFGENFDRKVWGENMEGYTRLRRTHANGARRFSTLDDVELVKNAYGLRTEAQRRNLRPVLLYLYAEPATWANGKAVDPALIEAHRADMKLFSESVEGDEVGFAEMTWDEMLTLWGRGKMALAEHASRLRDQFAPL
ncbi:hypothetical protein EOK75_00855 [Pseudorhodobacter turbinis]|uniref:Restriction endonuclease n=1 Tax=Pseudorhodobacter turbinis TaxID=2500533 RepID=A0A4P8ECS0_9RHOB|nr:hypothetical protein [Pseudorhodobacter turbinis]QCO54498.1 hypothetical protein EOK75_00855 [Pseudorhodobacter turbinis]